MCRLPLFFITCALCAAPEVERLATDFKFTEGPAVSENGTLYFSDIPANRIYSWSDTVGLQVFREDSGGANGLILDSDGFLYMCEGRNRRLSLLSPEGEYRILAGTYNGKALNSPNDLWIDPQGGIYFTDPRYGKSDDLEQDGEHLYYLPPEGDLQLAARDFVRPNGIIGTPDGKTLYVADHGGKVTYRFPITEPGQLGPREAFADQASDGMSIDSQGNLYLTDAAVDIYSPQGELIQSIEVPERPANVIVASENPITLYVTARKSVYKVTLN